MKSARLVVTYTSIFLAVATFVTVRFLKSKIGKKENVGKAEKGAPQARTNVMNDEIPSSLEQLNARLDRVNRWIENCDQKVYILLAFMGACIAVFFTSNIFLKARAILITPFYAYLKEHEAYSFSVKIFLLFIGLIAVAILTVVMIVYLLKALFPSTVIKKFSDDNPTLESMSLLHFESIAKMRFDDFEPKALIDINDRYKHDLLSQIFINSKICDNKFANLKKGLKAMSYLLLAIAVEATIVFLLP